MVILLYNGNSFHGQKFYPHDIMIITNRKGIIIYEKIYRRASDLSRHLRSGLVFRQALSGCGRSRLRHLNRNGNCPVYKRKGTFPPGNCVHFKKDSSVRRRSARFRHELIRGSGKRKAVSAHYSGYHHYIHSHCGSALPALKASYEERNFNRGRFFHLRRFRYCRNCTGH